MKRISIKKIKMIVQQKLSLLFCLLIFASIAIAQDQSTNSSELNPLTKFVGKWEGDYIRTIDSEVK